MTNKTIVVTGASRGVGEALVRAFRDKGWNSVGIARTAADGAIEADVRDPEQVARAFKSIGARYGSIDVLVNNAAIFRMKPFSEITLQEIDDIIDTNLKGTIFCTAQALPWMRSGARIVNIGSVAGTHGIKHQSIYCASKYGVDGFAEALNQELVERGISLTTIAPGGINTPLWDASTNPYPGDLDKVLQPRDVVGAVEYVTGLPGHVILKKLVMFPTNEWH